MYKHSFVLHSCCCNVVNATEWTKCAAKIENVSDAKMDKRLAAMQIIVDQRMLGNININIYPLLDCVWCIRQAIEK